MVDYDLWTPPAEIKGGGRAGARLPAGLIVSRLAHISSAEWLDPETRFLLGTAAYRDELERGGKTLSAVNDPSAEVNCEDAANVPPSVPEAANPHDER